MISSIGIQAKKTIRDIPIKEYKKVISKKNNLLWVDISNPSDEELSILKTIFDFHPLAIEDARKIVELPKIDDYEKYLFVVFHKIDINEKGSLVTKDINFFLGKNFIVSIHRNSNELFEEIKKKVSQNKDFKETEYIMHAVMDKIIDNYFPILDYWDEQIEKIEEEITKGKSEGVLKKIMKIKRQLSNFKKSLNPQRDLISKLAGNHYNIISDKAVWYFKDIHDHIFRIYSTLEHQSDMITVVFDAYLSSISIQQNENTNELNRVMQKLTLVSTIFLPLTFIASVYGMNFTNMPELGLKYSYYVVLLIMALIAVFMTVIFKRKKLL